VKAPFFDSLSNLVGVRFPHSPQQLFPPKSADSCGLLWTFVDHPEFHGFPRLSGQFQKSDEFSGFFGFLRVFNYGSLLVFFLFV